MATIFTDDEIDHKESDIEKIQTTSHMYISYSGSKGALHLGKEGFNNAIDECTNKNSPGNQIDIFLDEKENMLSISDNGRGIPFDKMELVCTTLQSGSKFSREGGAGASAGQNGVGMTAQNALSSRFEIISHRYGEKASIKFREGILTDPLNVKNDSSSTKHGTTVKFVPSPFYLGADCQIKAEEVMEWLDEITALVPARIKMTLSVDRIGKEASINKTYKNDGTGLKGTVKKMVKKPLLDPVHFVRTMKLPEIVNVRKDGSENATGFEQKEIERFIGLEVAFTFTSGTETSIKSYCNYVITIDHGQHVDGVRTGITNYLTRQARESLSEKEAKKIDIIPGDVLNGLNLALYLSTDMPPHFTGQTKEKVGNSIFFKPLQNMTYQALSEYFRQNPKDLKNVIAHIKTNAKARVEMNKVRNSVVRGETTSLDEHEIPFFYPANNKGKNDYRELFIVEGESALGSAKQGCFNDFQALYGLKGVPLNTFGISLDKILANTEMKNLVKILRTNIGERFNKDACNYKKIIIMTDSDIDGHRIFSLGCTFFLVHMAPLVEAGMIYKAVAPLYKLKDKDNEFVLNKQQYIEVFEKRVRANVKLIDPVNSTVKSHEFMQAFLLANREYLLELTRIAGHYAIHPEIVEFIAIHGDETDFKKKLGKRFPELKIDSDDMLTGIYEGRYQILKLDDLFFKRLTPLKRYVNEVNNHKVYFRVHEKDGKSYVDRGIMSIGSFMMLCQKYQPEIENRFKGLGELNPEQLRNTTLDPNKRILVRLTLEDLAKEMEKFRVLHGDSSEERKALMAHFKINREDLDN